MTSEEKTPIIPMTDSGEERPNPITITDKATRRQYCLDFNRDSVRFAESQGFKLGEVGSYMATQPPLLFHYAFRANHKGMSRQKTDDLFDKLTPFPSAILQRLIELYAFTLNSLYDTDAKAGDSLKNGDIDIQM